MIKSATDSAEITDLEKTVHFTEKTEYQFNIHQKFMNEAINCASRNIEQGGGPFGAVIVDKDGKMIAVCGNSVTKNNDPTAHAEINAIRAACKALNNF